MLKGNLAADLSVSIVQLLTSQRTTERHSDRERERERERERGGLKVNLTGEESLLF